VAEWLRSKAFRDRGLLPGRFESLRISMQKSINMMLGLPLVCLYPCRLAVSVTSQCQAFGWISCCHSMPKACRISSNLGP